MASIPWVQIYSYLLFKEKDHGHVGRHYKVDK